MELLVSRELENDIRIIRATGRNTDARVSIRVHRIIISPKDNKGRRMVCQMGRAYRKGLVRTSMSRERGDNWLNPR